MKKINHEEALKKWINNAAIRMNAYNEAVDAANMEIEALTEERDYLRRLVEPPKVKPEPETLTTEMPEIIKERDMWKQKFLDFIQRWKLNNLVLEKSPYPPTVKESSKTLTTELDWQSKHLELKRRIEKLEKHKDCQITENQSISMVHEDIMKRIGALEHQMRHRELEMGTVFGRLTELETNMKNAVMGGDELQDATGILFQFKKAKP